MRTWILAGLLVVTGMPNWARAADFLDADKASKKRDKLRAIASVLPNLDTSNCACPPFDASFRFKCTEGSVGARTRYRVPDQLEMVVQDAESGLPIVLGRDNTTIVYDPGRPELYVGVGCRFHLAVFGDARLEISPGLVFKHFKPGLLEKTPRYAVDRRTILKDPKCHSSFVVFDVASAMNLQFCELVDLGSTRNRIHLEQRRPDGKREEVELVLGQPSPVCRFRCYSAESDDVAIALDVTIHATGAAPLFNQASADSINGLKSHLLNFDDDSVSELLALGEGGVMVAQMLNAAQKHFALREPEARTDSLLPGFMMPDWKAVEANCAVQGPLLQKHFDVAPLPPMTPIVRAQQVVKEPSAEAR